MFMKIQSYVSVYVRKVIVSDYVKVLSNEGSLINET